MKKATLIFLLLLGYQALSGQGAKYIIRNYDLMSEVRLNGSTWAMVQDTNGILYFGADYGVAMYNGAYWEMASRGQSIVRSLLCSSQKKIVYGGFDDFGFLDHEISIGTVFNSLASQLPDSLRVFGDIWSICEVDGKLFFQAKNKIFVYENGKINAFPVGDCYHRGFVMSGSYLINQAGIGLTAFSGNAFTPVNGGEFFSDKVISSMIEMADGRILIGCRNFGFFLFDPLTGSVRESFPSHPETNRELSIKKIYHGILLPDGNLAVATLSGGTYLIDPEGNILKVINRNHGLRDNVNYFLGLSKDSNLWICTSNGVSAFNVNSPFILWDYTSGIDGVVLDMIDYQGHVYVGTLTGLYEISTGEIDQIRFEKGAESLLHTEVWSLLRVDRNGRSMLFLGSGNGLYQLDQSKPLLLKGGEAILKLKQPRSNPDILLAIHSDNIDVYRWDGTTFGYEAKIRNQFNGMRTAAEDDKGNLWIGTRSAGVVKISIDDLIGQGVASGEPNSGGVAGKPAVYYSFDGVLTDVIEYQGQVVFSNQGGLFSPNYSNGTFEKCQLFGPEIANTQRMISTLKKDSRGNIWIGGEDILLARPDGTFAIEKLNFQQLKDVFSAFVFLHSSDQKTWIGGNNGVYLYDNRITIKHPSHIQTIINRIEVLQDLTLFLNAPFTTPDISGMGKDILDIDLAKRNSQVTLYYSLPFFENERFTQFSYLLEGYQEEWSPWSSDTRVTFSNLRPMEYRFQVKGKTIYNQISEPAEVRFTVPRPWYLSSLAIALYALMFGVVVYLIARYISRVSIRKHLRIEDVIRKRIQESKRSHILGLLTDYTGQLSEPTAVPGHTGHGSALPPQTESREQQFLIRALKIMETHMGNAELTAGLFCKEFGMSQTKVYRKLISITGMSINQFIRNIRLKKAAQLLIESDDPISEVAYKTGFSSPGYFTKCFTEEFGSNPRDFTQKKH